MPALALLSFCLFFVVVIGLSVWKSRRVAGHAENSSDYFLGGRSLTWSLIGISIVAANISTEQLVGMAGQGAGSVGLAVSAWQLIGSLGIVIIAFTLLPRFLRAGIYTMPEFLEYRYNSRRPRHHGHPHGDHLRRRAAHRRALLRRTRPCRRSSASTLHRGVWIIGVIAALYTAWGGLKAVAWADLFQGLGLLLGGLLTFWLGLEACGGWASFSTANADKLHMILPADHPDLPWTGVASGMWIVIIYYCGLNQFIVAAQPRRQDPARRPARRDLRRRPVAARPLRHRHAGHHGQPALPGKPVDKPDEAFPTLIRELVPPGSAASSSPPSPGPSSPPSPRCSTPPRPSSRWTSTSGLIQPSVRREAAGPRSAASSPSASCGRLRLPAAPALADPTLRRRLPVHPAVPGLHLARRRRGLPRRLPPSQGPGAAGVAALVSGPIAYGDLPIHLRCHGSGEGLHSSTSSTRVFFTFLIIAAVMIDHHPRQPPLRAPQAPGPRRTSHLTTEPVVKIAGAAVILAVIAFFIVFW